MQQWEYLQVIRHGNGVMRDAQGRTWGATDVRIQTGSTTRWTGETQDYITWPAGIGFDELGAEGWELTAVLPNGVPTRYESQERDLPAQQGVPERSDARAQAMRLDLLIFRRPKV